jgi:hypothetical protein
MEKEFVSYDRALALKELGLKEDVLAWYDTENKLLNTGSLWQLFKNDDDVVLAPLKQQVFRWFREKYNIHHVIIWDSDTNNFDAGVFGELVNPYWEEYIIFHTYEEAENACIDKLIEICKQQKDE